MEVQAADEVFNREPDEVYCERECLDLPSDASVIALVSPPGTGKTKALCRCLEKISKDLETDPPRVVYVTHRHTLTSKAVATLPSLNGRSWLSYADIRGLVDIEQHQLIIIQYEATGRLTGYCKENCKNMILVLDEFNSTLHQMHGTFGDPMMAQYAFYHLSQWCNWVVAMDAHMDQERLDILERYTGRQAYLIQNTFRSRAHQTFKLTTNVSLTMAFIINSLSQGECVISPCFSKANGEELYKLVKANFGDSKTVLIYNSENRWNGEDVNITWKQADLLVYSSSIECGLSYEVCGHFRYCVCIFDNYCGPTYETAIQMLSRSRDTAEFIVCIQTRNFLLRKSDTPNGVLADFQREKKTQALDLAFYGIQGSGRDNGSGEWQSCNAYLSANVMTEVVQRRSTNSFQKWFLRLLQPGGAQVEQMIFDEGLTLPRVATDDIEIPESEEQKRERVQMLMYNYNCSDLDLNDHKFLKILGRKTKLAAYWNVSMLAILGTDFESALEQKRRDVSKATSGFDRCRHSGRFNLVLLQRAEFLAEVAGDCCDLEANEAARDFIEAVLGFPDPFNLPTLLDKEISDRLGCKLVMLEEREVRCVPHEKAREILVLLNKWVRTRPEINTPYRIPRENQLTLVKVINLVNFILKTMYDLQYIRDGNSINKTKHGIRTISYWYALQQSEDFTRFPDHEKGKPMLPAWATAPPGDLPESEILAVRGDIVQPAPAYSRRQAKRYTLQSFVGIEEKHLRPVKKQG